MAVLCYKIWNFIWKVIALYYHLHLSVVIHYIYDLYRLGVYIFFLISFWYIPLCFAVSQTKYSIQQNTLMSYNTALHFPVRMNHHQVHLVMVILKK